MEIKKANATLAEKKLKNGNTNRGWHLDTLDYLTIEIFKIKVPSNDIVKHHGTQYYYIQFVQVT